MPTPFLVRVQKQGNGAPVEGVEVRWDLSEGVGAALEPWASSTDSLGLASAVLTLGPGMGVYRVSASIRGREAPPVEFSAEAILAPEISGVSPGSFSVGDTITVDGSNFSLSPHQNVLSFSGIRGEVISSSSTQLQAVVPDCLVPRTHRLQVHIGALSTGALTVTVAGDPSSLALSPGEDRILDASEGYGCFFLPDLPGGLFLVAPHSTATVGGSQHGFSLASLASDGQFPVPSPLGDPFRGGWPPPSRARAKVRNELPDRPFMDARHRWDEGLRRREAELVRERRPLSTSGEAGPVQASSSRALPTLGDQRRFKVITNDDTFDRVTATVRYISQRTLVYVDETVPDWIFSDEMITTLAQEFENPIYPTVTGVFGQESDLDGNSRVIILFTPAVNRLTSQKSEGFVGGFFYGLDLLPGRDGSNGGEIFYAMVPDPEGEHGPVIGSSLALATLPAILAHEFEHMVHFNRRVLMAGAPTTEALWLSEALAQMAEDLVGDAFDEAGAPEKAARYRSGNWTRAYRFLENPSHVSVLASTSPGSLAERGAGWLLLKQVAGRPGQEGLLAALVSSPLAGVENLTEATGEDWRALMADWVGSLFLDGMGIPGRQEFDIPGIDLRSALSGNTGSYPLTGMPFGEASGFFSGTLWSSAPNYFIISPPAGGLTVSAGGFMGGLPEAPMGLQLLVVRLQ